MLPPYRCNQRPIRGASSGTPSTTVALAAGLAAMADLRGNPRCASGETFFSVSHTAHSLARRRLEPVVVPIVAEGWSTVLENRALPSRSPMQHRPAIEAAVNEMPRFGLKAAAPPCSAAPAAVGSSLSGSWSRCFVKSVAGCPKTYSCRGFPPAPRWDGTRDQGPAAGPPPVDEILERPESFGMIPHLEETLSRPLSRASSRS